jgi:hypothetical protein
MALDHRFDACIESAIDDDHLKGDIAFLIFKRLQAGSQFGRVAQARNHYGERGRL